MDRRARTVESSPWHAYLILLHPSRVVQSLAAVAEAKVVSTSPSLWQVELGVLRMWHRILFRSETIGLSTRQAPRSGLRVRLFRNRAIRFPFLLYEGSVIPWDLSGLLSTPERLMRHLLGTHHDGLQFIYDLEILDLIPGQLDELRGRADIVVERDDRRSRWLRDLCVYEGYHESLLAALKVAGDRGGAGLAAVGSVNADDPDIGFYAFLRWCARQPATPRETWHAWRRGEFQFSPEAA